MRSAFQRYRSAALFLATAFVAGVFASQPSQVEPGWDGRTLFEWIELSQGPSRARVGKAYDMLLEEEPSPTARQLQAMSAIRSIGTNAIPPLLRNLRTEQFWDAVAGFEALGEIAAPAIPELTALLNSDEQLVRDKAMIALGRIGPAASAATPALLRELKKDNVNAAIAFGLIRPREPEVIRELIRLFENAKENWNKLQVVVALGKIGPPAAPATAKLIEIADVAEGAIQARTEFFQIALLRQRAVEALGKIGDQRALPMLKRMLEAKKHPGNIVNLALRRTLMRALGDFGPAAKEAIPTLIEISANPNTEPRDQAVATETIIRINARAL